MTTSRPPFLSGRRPRVIAHRGFAPGGEGNTLESFERALAAGADLLETDVRASLDGVAVLVHDASLDDDQSDDTPAPRITPSDGSLGIGSLKGDSGHE